MDEMTTRFLELVFIFLGICLRTATPAIQKLAVHRDVFQFEWRWLGSALTAFLASWYIIIMTIPADFDIINRLILAFGIAYAGNSVVNDTIMKWAPVRKYFERGETPTTTEG